MAGAVESPVECIQLAGNGSDDGFGSLRQVAGSARISREIIELWPGRLDVQIFSPAPGFQSAPSKCPLRKIADRVDRLVGIRSSQFAARIVPASGTEQVARDFEDGRSNVKQPAWPSLAFPRFDSRAISRAREHGRFHRRERSRESLLHGPEALAMIGRNYDQGVVVQLAAAQRAIRLPAAASSAATAAL